MTILFGRGRLFIYRLLPITLGLCSLLALGFSLYRAIGPPRAAAVMWLIGGVPMTSNMMHVVALHEYALALFFFELAILLRIFSEGVTRRWHLVTLALVAFLEGWTAFDYVFFVTFAPLAVFLAFKDSRNPVSRRRLVIATLTAGGAFALALLLHFVQVAVFLGGLREAFLNFTAAAKNRSTGATWVHPPIRGALGIILYYWVNLLPQKLFYDGNFVALLAVVLALLWPKRASLVIGDKGTVVFSSTWSRAASFVIMLALGCGWLVVMQQHSSIHGHFLPRLFTSVILWAYVLVTHLFSFERSNTAALETS
jgi:hypothetical protein